MAGLYNGSWQQGRVESSSEDPRRAAIAEVRLQFRGTGVRTHRLLHWRFFFVDFYVQHASNIPKVYGTLAGFIIIILMTWIYIANLILLIGAEINAALEELTDAGASR